jgi:hypothetical protein
MEITSYNRNRITVKLKARLTKGTKKYKNVLSRSKQSGINRFNTAAIIWNMSHEVFGYDKFSEVTIDTINESTCFLSVKKNADFLFLFEVYPITYELGTVNNIQISDYEPFEGMKNVVVTDGISWNVYRIDPNLQPCLTDQFNFLQLDPKNTQDIEMLYKMCREL